MIDKAAIFENVLRRNLLRRQAGLPQRPVRETYDRTVAYASWCEYSREHGARIRAEVLAEQRARYGADWPTSGGGRTAYACLVAKALAESFRAQHWTRS